MLEMSEQLAHRIVELTIALSLALGLIITALALIGYRNNRSRPMLFLAVGIAFLTVIQLLTSVVTARLGPAYLISVSTQLAELIGLSLILYSIVLARRQ